MKFATLILLLVTSVLTSGCATSNTCAGWDKLGPVKPSRKDVLTDGTKDQILAINEFGKRQGCWSKPNTYGFKLPGT